MRNPRREPWGFTSGHICSKFCKIHLLQIGNKLPKLRYFRNIGSILPTYLFALPRWRERPARADTHSLYSRIGLRIVRLLRNHLSVAERQHNV